MISLRFNDSKLNGMFELSLNVATIGILYSLSEKEMTFFKLNDPKSNDMV